MFIFRKLHLFILCAIVTTTFTANARAAGTSHVPYGETAAQHQRIMKWWHQAKFGLFIHWGIYAVPGHGEWYMNNGRIPRDQYAQYAKQFDPVKFNADEWVKLAHDAGMRYLVITSKHHDGFCMFNTAATKYNVVDDTPWHKDPLKALSAACRKYGVHFGVYYSIMDWHSPDQEASHPSDTRPIYNPTHFKPGKEQAYIQYMETQLKELITQYHPQVIWFDGGWMHGWTNDDGKEIVTFIHKLDPDMIINDRIGHSRQLGDYRTPEQHIPAKGLNYDWETCMTIANGPWGYSKYCHSFKSAPSLIQRLATIASEGGNYLLNVGPKPDGTIPKPEADRLRAMGAWLKVNGDSIYGTTGCPLSAKVKWGVISQRKATDHTTFYLHVFHWPANGQLVLPAVPGKVTRAYLLASPQKTLAVEQAQGKLTITVPAKAIDPADTVVAVEAAPSAPADAH